MGMVLQGASAGLKGLNAYAGAKQQKSSLKFQAALDGLNAKSDENQAQSSMRQGAFEQQNQMLKTAQLKSNQRAEMAAGNIDLGTGSAANVLASTEYMGDVDKNIIAMNAMRQAFGFQTQANNYKNDAIMQNAGAKQVKPWMSAATSLIGGSGQVASSWYQRNAVGLNGGSASGFSGGSLDAASSTFALA
jgi:hypothetical protein